MGQAKRRGTYEERRQQAIARRRLEDEERRQQAIASCDEETPRYVTEPRYTKQPRRSARDVTMLAALLGASLWGGGR